MVQAVWDVIVENLYYMFLFKTLFETNIAKYVCMFIFLVIAVMIISSRADYAGEMNQ